MINTDYANTTPIKKLKYNDYTNRTPAYLMGHIDYTISTTTLGLENNDCANIAPTHTLLSKIIKGQLKR